MLTGGLFVIISESLINDSVVASTNEWSGSAVEAVNNISTENIRNRTQRSGEFGGGDEICNNSPCGFNTR